MEPMKATEPMKPAAPMTPPEPWWPGHLGTPASAGSRDDVRHAYFADARRLAVQAAGEGGGPRYRRPLGQRRRPAAGRRERRGHVRQPGRRGLAGTRWRSPRSGQLGRPQGGDRPSKARRVPFPRPGRRGVPVGRLGSSTGVPGYILRTSTVGSSGGSRHAFRASLRRAEPATAMPAAAWIPPRPDRSGGPRPGGRSARPGRAAVHAPAAPAPPRSRAERVRSDRGTLRRRGGA